MSGRRNLVQRLSVGVVDQIFSSGSNFVALLVGARYLDAESFGFYSVALLSYTFTLGITRALCSEALLVRPGEDEPTRGRRTRLATGAAVWVGLVAAAIFTGVALASDGSLSRSFMVLALAIPGLMLQDTLRYAAFSRGSPKSALASDLIWFVGQVAIFVVLISRGTPAAWSMLVAYSAPGVVAGVSQATWERLMPRLRGGFSWIIRNRDLSVRYALDFLSAAGAAQLAAYALVLVAGATDVGSIRGAQTLFGPVNILLTGSYIVLVPEGRAAAKRSAAALTRVCGAAAAGFSVVAASMLIFYRLLSTSQGELILGSTWSGAQSLLLPVGVASMAGAAGAGAMAGLRSLSAAQIILRIRMFTLPTTVALPIIGALQWQASGLAWGIALASTWKMPWYWLGYFKALREFVATEGRSAGDVMEPLHGHEPATAQPDARPSR